MIVRLREFLKNTLTWYILIASITFLVSMYVLIFVIGSLDRSIDLGTLRQIVLLAILYSLLLSFLKKPRLLLQSILSFSSGVIVAFTIVGDLLQPSITYIQFGNQYILSLIRYRSFPENIDPARLLMQDQWTDIEHSIDVLYNRLINWLTTLPEATYDPVSQNLTWGIIIWLTSIWVYWFVLRKKKVVTGFTPLLVIIAAASPLIESWLVWLLLILGFGLLLIVLSHQANLEEYWLKNKFRSSELIRRNTGQISLYLTASIILFATLITSPELEDFIDEFRERRQKSASSSESANGESDTALLEEEPTSGPEEVLNETADGWLPNVHLIGNNPELAKIEVFQAKVQDPYTGIAPRYYFRSATYETFDLRGWRNLDKDYILVPAEEDFEIDFTPNQQLIYQEVTLLRDFPNGNLIYVVGELSAANVPYYGSYHTKFVNNTYTDLFASVTDETQYSAYSVIPYFGEDELRNTTQDYPSWIENKYLQVPETTPDRVYDLALTLTATEPTPYDRVLAIESYLRNFEYALEIDSPPKSRDIVDYFLFDIQKGYCDYFASAMVLLTRAAGIPARLATGYLASTYNSELGQFSVTADQAHSWAEVYFPEYGWVTFEPTAGQPSLIRYEERELEPENLAFESTFDSPTQELADKPFSLVPENLFVLTGELMTVFLLGMMAFHWINRWVLMAMDQNLMLSRIYRRLRKMAKQIGIKVYQTDTPLEFLYSLSKGLTALSETRSMNFVLRFTPENSAIIIQACNQAAFANTTLPDEQIQQVVDLWVKIRWQLIFARFLYQLQPIHAGLKRIWFRLQQPA